MSKGANTKLNNLIVHSGLFHTLDSLYEISLDLSQNNSSFSLKTVPNTYNRIQGCKERLGIVFIQFI